MLERIQVFEPYLRDNANRLVVVAPQGRSVPACNKDWENGHTSERGPRCEPIVELPDHSHAQPMSSSAVRNTSQTQCGIELTSSCPTFLLISNALACGARLAHSIFFSPALSHHKIMSLSTTNANEALARMGYDSQLPRSLSMVTILGLSFAIMAVPFGLSTTINIALTDGQAVTMLYGWILVSLISLCIAASLAEICAVYPTSGGVYYWSTMLSPRKWAPLVGFVDGWLTLVGNWTVTLSINFSGSQLILSAISLWNEDFNATRWQTVLAFWAVMIVCALINIFASQHLGKLNHACIYWTATSVIILMVTLLAMAKNRRSSAFVWSHYDASQSGWPAGWAFFVGLLQGMSRLFQCSFQVS